MLTLEQLTILSIPPLRHSLLAPIRVLFSGRGTPSSAPYMPIVQQSHSFLYHIHQLIYKESILIHVKIPKDILHNYVGVTLSSFSGPLTHPRSYSNGKPA